MFHAEHCFIILILNVRMLIDHNLQITDYVRFEPSSIFEQKTTQKEL